MSSQTCGGKLSHVDSYACELRLNIPHGSHLLSASTSVPRTVWDLELRPCVVFTPVPRRTRRTPRPQTLTEGSGERLRIKEISGKREHAEEGKKQKGA